MIGNVKSKEDTYIQKYMEKMPAVEKGEARVIKKGDNLWNIARSQLGKKSKRGQINDYMLAIAKLNNLNTTQKMNNLKVNTTIYLPKAAKDNSVNQPDPKQTKCLSQDKTVTQNKVQPKVQPKAQPKTSAEKYFDDKMNIFFNDKNVKVEKALYMPDLYDEMYHVSYSYADKKGYIHRDKPIMTVTLSKDTKKLEDIAFEGDENIYPYGYDYKIGKDNVIRTNNPVTSQVHGKITPELRSKLEKALLQQINKK